MNSDHRGVLIVTERIPPIFGGAGIRAYRFACRLEQKKQLSGLMAFSSFARTDYEARIQKLQTKIQMVSKSKLFLIPHWSAYRFGRMISPIIALFNLIFIFIFTGYYIFRIRKTTKIILCFSLSPLGFVSILAGKLFGVKTVTEMVLMGTDDPIAENLEQRTWIKRWYRKLTFRYCDHFIGISKALTDRFIEAGYPPDRITQIGNPVDLNLFKTVGRDEKNDLKEKLKITASWHPLISFVGAITMRKGVDLLLRVFESILKVSPNAGLVIVGPSENTEEQKKLTEQLIGFARTAGFSDRVLFTGQVSNVHEYLQASDLFLFTSRREGFANVIIEAMATGLPVIALNIPKTTETIITNENDGFIIFGENPEAFVQVFKRIESNPDLRDMIRKNAIEKVRTYFAVEVIDKEYERLFQKLSE